MKYKIEFIEVKTAASGNKYARTTISNEAGEMKENVAIFGTFPGFETLMAGHTIEAELAEKDYNGSKSYSLVAPRPAGGSKGGANLERVMEKKANLIGEAQSRKAERIAAAQDRSAWMWAKRSASEIVNGWLARGESEPQHTVRDILELATEIYNGEPVRPF